MLTQRSRHETNAPERPPVDPLPGRASLRKRWGAPLASLIQNGPPSRVKPSPLVSPRFPRSENWRHIFPLLHCEEEKQSRGESHKRALPPEFLQQRLIRALGHGDAEHDFHRARLAALIDAHVALKGQVQIGVRGIEAVGGADEFLHLRGGVDKRGSIILAGTHDMPGIGPSARSRGR